ncbi:MAG: hypothetical protein HY060_02845 [Proteobacteria bacterium]|nr:hypothetical protein [Pseudomonadota bacterium]
MWLTAALLLALLLSGCGTAERHLRNPQTGETATCSFGPILGDVVVRPDDPYCRCLSDRVAQGFVLTDEPTLYLCPVERPKDG